MEGGTVSEVVASNNERFAPGDIVLGHTGWQTHAVSNGGGLRKLDPALAPVSTALGVLGMPGMTAYAGLLEIGKPQPGETVVVAAASGAVGSVVGQIAQDQGRARGRHRRRAERNARYVTDELGFDDCVDHRAPDFAERLKAACPKGIDVYFENVGGAVFEAVLPLFNPFARVPVCGLISQYNATSPPRGHDCACRSCMRSDADQAAQYPRLHRHRFRRAPRRLPARHGGVDQARAASSIARTSSRDLENAPRAFIGLLRGENFGKRLVRVRREAAVKGRVAFRTRSPSSHRRLRISLMSIQPCCCRCSSRCC